MLFLRQDVAQLVVLSPDEMSQSEDWFVEFFGGVGRKESEVSVEFLQLFVPESAVFFPVARVVSAEIAANQNFVQ